jgi:hypothetical protein
MVKTLMSKGTFPVAMDVISAPERFMNSVALIVHDCLEAFRIFVEPLSECPFGGNAFQCKGLFEKPVFPKDGYGFVVALAQAKKSDESLHDIAMGYTSRKGSNRSPREVNLFKHNPTSARPEWDV